MGMNEHLVNGIFSALLASYMTVCILGFYYVEVKKKDNSFWVGLVVTQSVFFVIVCLILHTAINS